MQCVLRANIRQTSNSTAVVLQRDGHGCAFLNVLKMLEVFAAAQMTMSIKLTICSVNSPVIYNAIENGRHVPNSSDFDGTMAVSGGL